LTCQSALKKITFEINTEGDELNKSRCITIRTYQTEFETLTYTERYLWENAKGNVLNKSKCTRISIKNFQLMLRDIHEE